jgi:hypothetical protein
MARNMSWTVFLGFGLIGKSRQGKPILGYSDTEAVKLDFDDITFKNVKYWANRTVKLFKLGGYIILKSSKKSYHVVFDKTVSWTQNMMIVAWVALHSKNRGLTIWFIMQAIKKSSTLRVSNKNKKTSSRIVHRYGKQDTEIQEFLAYRKHIKHIIRHIQKQHRSLSLIYPHV